MKKNDSLRAMKTDKTMANLNNNSSKKIKSNIKNNKEKNGSSYSIALGGSQ